MIQKKFDKYHELPPLSLYVHLPWCVKKCPYCDFNSHTLKDNLPEELYVNALLRQLDQHLSILNQRPLISIFFGGGTPSLFSAKAIERILNGIAKRISLVESIEITLEANPGTIDQAHFKGYASAGVNRISVGVQSFQDDKLKLLGRIHQRDHALRAVEAIAQANINNFNLDLMYGLPEQTLTEASQDLETAITCQPTHLSWYQLTIEPNTVFYKQTPTLPPDELLWEMQLAGQSLLEQHGYQQYEVSAYAKAQRECVHNRHYWEYGDYLGIGAGAHSKLTQATGEIQRFHQVKQPEDYLLAAKRQDKNITLVDTHDRIFEFMLNALRLTDGVPTSLFTKHTYLPLSIIDELLAKAKQRQLLIDDSKRICTTALGKRYLNDVVALFLHDS